MNLQLKDFEGPLDLLLHLVRVNQMDIYEVNIREIIEQYLNFIDSIDKYNIDLSSEYLVMASELLHLKSKMLINSDMVDEEEDVYEINSEEDLRNKLIEYEKYKNICEDFKELENNRKEYFTKVPESLNEYVEDNKVLNSDVGIEDLLNAFLEMQKRLFYAKPVTTKITRKELSVKERIFEIREVLNKKGKVEFSELFDFITKENIVVTFLSLLDMSKSNEIYLTQEKNFSNIYIEKK